MKKFLIGFVLLLIIVVVGALAATGIVKVPFLSQALGGTVRDLGVALDPAAFERINEEYDIDFQGDPESYCISCDNVVYEEPTPLDGGVNSSELSSIIQKVNNKSGVLKGISVKLGDNNQGEMAAELDLTSFGVDVKVPVYVDGSFSVSGNTVSININGGKVGPMPLPADYVGAGEEYLSNAINARLSEMPELRIDDLSVSDGILNYDGVFPRVIKSKQ